MGRGEHEVAAADDLVLNFARHTGLRMRTKGWHRVQVEGDDTHTRYVTVNDKPSDLRKHFRILTANQDQRAADLLSEFRAPGYVYASEVHLSRDPDPAHRMLLAAIATPRSSA